MTYAFILQKMLFVHHVMLTLELKEMKKDIFVKAYAPNGMKHALIHSMILEQIGKREFHSVLEIQKNVQEFKM